MLAPDPPAIVEQAPGDNQTDVIEIVGTRPDQAQKIDRRAYRVQQNPHSAQKDAIQLLRGLPAVTVSPDDQINLLGSGNVRIFVDGRPYLGDAKQYLRTLHGSDIDRVEVITNPSAQYSAEGTAGIINFVLRRKQGEGMSGTASADQSSRGRGNADATVKIKHKRWTYEFETHETFGSNGRSTYHKLRSVRETPAGTPTTNTEDGSRRPYQISGAAGAKVSYELDSRTSVSAKILAGAGRSIVAVNTDFAGLTPDFVSFSERRRSREVVNFLITELTFDHKGTREGETLNASLQLFGNPKARTRNSSEFSDGSALSIRQSNRLFFGTGQLDWQHPRSKGQILSLGGTWNFWNVRQRYVFASAGNDGSLGPDAVDQSHAVSNTVAAYATFQQPIGTWTFMPGIRAEWNSRQISSPGLPDVRIERTNLFPTLHLKHPLSKTLDLTLSYSKRIDRADAWKLRPFRAVEDVLTIFQGNPRLKDQSTDAYEINLHYHRKKIDAGIILYDRETSGLWSQNYTVVDGVNVYTWVNAGHRRDSGVQLDLSTPIVRRVKVNASVNLFYERAPIDAAVGAESDDTFR